MSLAATSTLLGGLLALASGANGLDPATAVAWGGMGAALGTWLPGNCIVLPAGAGPLTAAGAAVTGSGSYIFASDENDLGPRLAIAAGIKPTDTVGIAYWTRTAKAIIQFWTLFGQVDPALFVAVPAGGPVTGTGLVKFSNPAALGLALVAANNTKDPAGVAGWLAFGATLVTQITLSAQVIPSIAGVGLQSPAGGGTLTGVGTVI